MEKNKKVNINNIAIFYAFTLGLYQFSDKLFGSVYMIKLNEQFPVATISIIVAFSKFVMLLFDYPSGVIADMIGRKKTGGIALIIFGIGFYIFALANTLPLYFLAIFVLDVAVSLQSGAPQAWFYEILVKYKETEKREHLISKAVTVGHVFSIGASILSIYLISKSIVLPLYIAGTVSIIGGIIFLLFYEDNKAENKNKESFLTIIKKYSKSFFADKRMRSVLFIELNNQMGFYVFLLIWQLVLLNKYNVQYSFISVMLIILMVALALGSMLTGKLYKWINLFKIFYISKFLIAISFIMLFLSKNLYVTVIFLFIYDFALSMSRTSYSIWLNDYIKSDNRSSYFSMISSLKAFYGVILIPVAGYLIEYIGYSPLWLVAGIFELISIYGFYYFLKHYKEQKEV